jgi:hypothetical protein
VRRKQWKLCRYVFARCCGFMYGYVGGERDEWWRNGMMCAVEVEK